LKYSYKNSFQLYIEIKLIEYLFGVENHKMIECLIKKKVLFKYSKQIQNYEANSPLVSEKSSFRQSFTSESSFGFEQNGFL
jgi:hypothetical protein